MRFNLLFVRFCDPFRNVLEHGLYYTLELVDLDKLFSFDAICLHCQGTLNAYEEHFSPWNN